MSHRTLTALELAERLEGVLVNCPGDRVLSEVLPLGEARGTSVSFLANEKYRSKALESAAGVILATREAELGDQPQLLLANPYKGFAESISLLHPEPAPETCTEFIHPTAEVAPGVLIGAGSTVGARTVLAKGWERT